MMTIRAISIGLMMGVFAGVCSAAEDHHHNEHKHEGEHEQHSAHVHGHAKLFVVLEGKVLELLFESPAINLLGFEHKPESDQQSAKFEQVLSELNQPRGLFSVSEQAGCELSEKQIEVPYQDKDAGEGHADYRAQYRFECQNPDELQNIPVQLLKRFPLTESIEVQSISSSGQKAYGLTSANSQLSF